jgi:anti-sigma factor RsiW
MLRCRDIGQLLHDYVEGDLGPGTAQELEAHLADCPGCLGFVNTYRETVAVAHELRCDDIPPELQDKLQNFLARKRQARGPWARLRAPLGGLWARERLH